jgi:hypothetical protein
MGMSLKRFAASFVYTFHRTVKQCRARLSFSQGKPVQTSRDGAILAIKGRLLQWLGALFGIAEASGLVTRRGEGYRVNK